MKSMSKSLSDSVLYLKNLVSKKGKSFKGGVYYINPSISIDVEGDFTPYALEQDQANDSVTDFLNGYGHDSQWLNCWNSLLVNLRCSTADVDIYSIVAREHLLEFISEDTDLTLKVTVPQQDIAQFPPEVLFYRGLLRRVARFAGKTPVGLRFSIGIASLDWDDVVGLGEARKVDVSF